MDILTYRRIVVNTDKNKYFSKQTWNSENITVQPWWRYTDLHTKNHPLVNSHKAYWTNKTTLCIGYKMIDNNDIFRPIFSHKRQVMINEFQPNIAIAVKKRSEKMAYMALVKIKKLPVVLVEEIINLIY